MPGLDVYGIEVIVFLGVRRSGIGLGEGGVVVLVIVCMRELLGRCVDFRSFLLLLVDVQYSNVPVPDHVKWKIWVGKEYE